MKSKIITKIVINNKGGSIIKLITIFLVTISFNLHAQGTINFDDGHWYSKRPALPGYGDTTYAEQGFLFQVVVPTLGTFQYPYYDHISITQTEIDDPNMPYNPTKYLLFQQYASPDDYVSFSQTSGETFGLTSVALSILTAVTFYGTKADGTFVEQTFDDTSDPFSWQLCKFDSDFASDLISVDIKAEYLRMDNLTFIPEPGTTALFTLGLLACWRTLRKRKFCQ